MSSSTIQASRETFRPAPVEVKYASPGTPASPITPSKIPPGMALGAASTHAAWQKVSSEQISVTARAAQHALDRVRGSVTRSTSGSEEDDCKSTISSELAERPTSCPPTERTEKVAQILNRVTEQAKSIAAQRKELDERARELDEQRKALVKEARPFIGLQSLIHQIARENQPPVLNYEIEKWEYNEKDRTFNIQFTNQENFSLFLTDWSTRLSVKKYESTLSVSISPKNDSEEADCLTQLSQIFGKGFEQKRVEKCPTESPDSIKVKSLVPIEGLSDLTLDDLAKLSKETLKETLSLLKGYLKV